MNPNQLTSISHALMGATAWVSDSNPIARGLRTTLLPVAYGETAQDDLFLPDETVKLNTPLGTVQAYHFHQATPADKRDRAIVAIFGNRSPALTSSNALSLSTLGQVVSLDMPGYGVPAHGHSDAPLQGMENFELSLAAYTNAVMEYVCRDLGIPEHRVTFFGSSMGSTAATIAYANHPQSSLFLSVPFLSVAELLPTLVGKNVRRLLPASIDPTHHTASASKAAEIGFQAAQMPFYGWAIYGRTVGRVLATMAFPAGTTSAAVPGFVTNGMDNRARLRAVADAGTHTGSVFVMQAQCDHLMGHEYGRKLGEAINANPAHLIDFTLHTIPEGDHRSRARPGGDTLSSAPPWFSDAQKQRRQAHEAAAWEITQAWFDR